MTCAHQLAEPVILTTTGETVACICVACHEQLSADWIRWQYDKAHREAYCTHDEEVSIRALQDPGDTLLCVHCGRMRED